MPNMCIAFFLSMMVTGLFSTPLPVSVFVCCLALCMCMCMCHVCVRVYVYVCKFRDLESGSSKTKLLGLERWRAHREKGQFRRTQYNITHTTSHGEGDNPTTNPTPNPTTQHPNRPNAQLPPLPPTTTHVSTCVCTWRRFESTHGVFSVPHHTTPLSDHTTPHNITQHLTAPHNNTLQTTNTHNHTQPHTTTHTTSHGDRDRERRQRDKRGRKTR